MLSRAQCLLFVWRLGVFWRSTILGDCVVGITNHAETHKAITQKQARFVICVYVCMYTFANALARLMKSAVPVAVHCSL